MKTKNIKNVNRVKRGYVTTEVDNNFIKRYNYARALSEQLEELTDLIGLIGSIPKYGNASVREMKKFRQDLDQAEKRTKRLAARLDTDTYFPTVFGAFNVSKQMNNMLQKGVVRNIFLAWDAMYRTQQRMDADWPPDKLYPSLEIGYKYLDNALRVIASVKKVADRIVKELDAPVQKILRKTSIHI